MVSPSMIGVVSSLACEPVPLFYAVILRISGGCEALRPSGSRASLHEVRQCLARLSRLAGVAATHRHQPLEAELDALTKPITSSFSTEADVCMVDAEPVATPADALDDSSDKLDGGAAGQRGRSDIRS